VLAFERVQSQGVGSPTPPSRSASHVIARAATRRGGEECRWSLRAGSPHRRATIIEGLAAQVIGYGLSEFW